VRGCQVGAMTAPTSPSESLDNVQKRRPSHLASKTPRDKHVHLTYIASRYILAAGRKKGTVGGGGGGVVTSAEDEDRDERSLQPGFPVMLLLFGDPRSRQAGAASLQPLIGPWPLKTRDVSRHTAEPEP
jgi:hypothetical protein